MNIATIFSRLGLTKSAPVVYQTLQKKGLLLVNEIARHSGLHRPSVYAAIRDLLRLSFIQAVPEGKRMRYCITDPNRIAREFAGVSVKTAQEVARILPPKEKEPQENVRFISGKQGIRATFDDVIEHMPRGKTFYRYTSEQDLDAVNAYISPNYRIRRDKKKLERLVISNPKSGLRKRSRLERFVKFIPPKDSLFEQNIIQLVYGERLAFIDLNTEQCIIIENKALADFQKVIFRQLYRKLS